MSLNILFPNGNVLAVLTYIDDPILGVIPWNGEISVALPAGAATEATLVSVKTAVETIDNFISGNRGLVTEDNSAAILAELAQKTEPANSQHATIDNVSLAVTNSNLDASLSSILTELGQKTEPANQQHVIVDSGAGLTDAELRAADVKITLDGESVPVTGTFYQATQPVSLAGSVGVTGPLTDTELRASDVKVTLDSEQVSVSNFPATQPISAISLPLPTLASTAAKQDTGNTSLASIDTKLTNPLPISATSLPLPTLAATSGKQDTGNASLSSIDTKLTNPLPVSGAVTTGGLTDTELRASAVPVTASNTFGLESTQLLVETAVEAIAAKDFATETTLALIESGQADVLELDGNQVAFSTDYLSRRIEELNFLNNQLQNMNNLLSKEPIQRGMELR